MWIRLVLAIRCVALHLPAILPRSVSSLSHSLHSHSHSHSQSHTHTHVHHTHPLSLTHPLTHLSLTHSLTRPLAIGCCLCPVRVFRLIDAAGKVKPVPYLAYYAGDYDGSAWLYSQLKQNWDDPRRGQVPIGWYY